ncbi:S-adenosyl-dependent methyl transferase MraW [Candidatus Glomeribacter gigasporarum BEG34]|uniref:Ribosomal RNA small subunit methyltransferase H n=1 Tax=Candidatus Glomeribacter gigasporarum BEG34 TaxID=1070319 RepID=G2J909_9BURK|nr:16S rRNA (cytosine(1402)-N(4))-methyltransferase RsmH [Candidatus Glomeribacter gigasporarum]CCD29256.1 S-adenosyl-dependent methyl transferase MraW [Candidatus Glomeribacter gigasporarum BEG34]
MENTGRGSEGNRYEHRPVLLNEAVDALVWRTDGFYIDGTFGRGGHSRAILARLAPGGRLLAFDKDPEACAAAQLITDARFEIVHGDCAALREQLNQRNAPRVSGVLLDLGLSSPQLDNPARGFSFSADGPLDMRMDPRQGESAAQWLARASQQEMTEVIRRYGEERFAGQIAKAITARRMQSDRYGPLARTRELAELVARAVKTRPLGRHPATRTFQAIRIYLNQELQTLSAALDAALEILEPGGRLVVMSFHSLEDRIVKRFMQTHARAPQPGAALRYLPLRAPAEPAPALKLGPRIRARDAERKANVRARSAVMRSAEKLG